MEIELRVRNVKKSLFSFFKSSLLKSSFKLLSLLNIIHMMQEFALIDSTFERKCVGSFGLWS